MRRKFRLRASCHLIHLNSLFSQSIRSDLEMQHAKFLCQVDLFAVPSDSDTPTSATSNNPLLEGGGGSSDRYGGGGPSSPPYSARAPSIAGSTVSRKCICIQIIHKCIKDELFLETDGSKVTNALVGEIYTHVAVVPDFQSVNHAYFVYGVSFFLFMLSFFPLETGILRCCVPSSKRPENLTG